MTIRRIDLRGASSTGVPVDYRAVVPRAEFDVEAAAQVVQPILDAVKARGVEAILEFGARFDKVELSDIRVPASALADALDELDPAVQGRPRRVDPAAASDLRQRARGRCGD